MSAPDFKKIAEELIEEWRNKWPAEGVYADFICDGKFRMTFSPAESLACAIAEAMQAHQALAKWFEEGK